MSDRPDSLPAENHAASRHVRVEIGASLDDLVAVKTGTNSAGIVAVEREALILGQLRHPNVVELVRVERTPNTVRLVTEFAGRATLADFRPTDVSDVSRIAAALLTVVSDLHRMGWVHGRLVAEHCVLGRGGRITLCGLGAAHRVPIGDERREREMASALTIIDGLASRLTSPGDRNGRRRHRRLQSILRVPRESLSPEVVNRLRVEFGALGGAEPATGLIDIDGDGETTVRPSGRVIERRHSPLSRRRRARRIETPTPLDATTAVVPLRSEAGTRPSRTRGVVTMSATVVALLGFIALLRWLGGPLGIKHSEGAAGVTRLGDVPEPVLLALSVIRLGAFGATLYGIALATMALAAILTRRPDIERLATRMAPPRLRKVLVSLIGLGVLSSAATGSGPTLPRPQSVVALEHSEGHAVGAPTAGPQLTPTTDHGTTTTTSTVSRPESTAENETVVGEKAGADTPPPTLPNMWVIRPGDHLWSVAAHTLSAHLGRIATDDEVDPYWRAVVKLNRSSLVNPNDPDLVFSGQVIELPPLPSGGAGG